MRNVLFSSRAVIDVFGDKVCIKQISIIGAQMFSCITSFDEDCTVSLVDESGSGENDSP